MRIVAFLAVLFCALPAFSQEQLVRIAFIDPLSGPMAAVTQNGFNHFRFMAERLSSGRVKYEVTGYDNKLSPQETIVQAQKAIDAGIRIIAQGNGSGPAGALTDFIAKHNERNPEQAAIYLNYAAADPALTNDKCNAAHFRYDADTDMKMLALAKFIGSRRDIRRVYLINQDYSFGQAVRATALKFLKQERPDIDIVGDELHPLAKINDFAPYVAKIKASRADSVITGNWGNDLALLLKAAADASLQAGWYTYYASGIGSPTIVRQTGLAHRVFAVVEGHANLPQADKIEDEYRARFGGNFVVPRIRLLMEMLNDAVVASNSVEPRKLVPLLSSATRKTMYNEMAIMRSSDHQVLQDLYIASLGPLEGGMKFDEEKTGWGWKTAGRVAAAQTALPTTCKMPAF